MSQLNRIHRGSVIALTVLLLLGLVPPFLLTAHAAAPIGEPSTETPKDGGTWTIGVADEPDTLDPHKTASARANLIMRQVCDPLIAQDFDGTYVPGLASSWTISDDGLHWTFHLRQDVTFQDGTPFNAHAVKFSFDRILDPSTASASAISLLGPMISTTVGAEFTFGFTLSTPFAPLLDNLAHAGLLCIVSPTAVAAAGTDFGRKPVSTGPYLIAEWRAGDRISMTRNPNYSWAPGYLHQDGPAHIETIVWRIIVEEASRVAAFEAGEIDQIDVPALDVARFRDSGDYTTIDYLNPGVTFFEFNVTQPPFDDPRVRQAFNYAINTQDILDAAIDGNGELAHGFLPPSIWGYWPGIVDYAPRFDPDKATSLLADAGWTDSDGDGTLDKNGQPLSVTIDTASFDSWQRATQVAQAHLAEIGVELKIETFEFGTLLNNLKTGEHQMEMMGYIYTEPDIAYIWFDSANAGTGVNYSHIKDAHLDDLIAQGRSTLDPEARMNVYEEIQQYIVDLAVWVPLWVDSVTVAFSSRLHHAELHPDAYVVYYDAWVE